jgi:hypothetical protein
MFWFLLANGKLYEFAKESFDLCFTRDSGFANAVKGASTLTGAKSMASNPGSKTAG